VILLTFEKEGISQINFDELKDIIENRTPSPILIDVRENEEYVEGHIPGVPLLPMGDIVDLIDQFDTNEEYILVCRSGRRSHEVAKFFKTNGIEKVHNYTGGMLDWNAPVHTGEGNIIKDVRELYNQNDKECE
jgi:rhodanese-related sulfurtransferase